MKAFSWRERQQDLRRLNEKIYDLCIIGGGITGAAIARDAALRGLSVLLVEKDDFASGTSSRSSKLIHGGIRYLAHFEFALVRESTRERALLWKLAPELCAPLPFIYPGYGHSEPVWKLSAGLWLYELLALFRTPTLHRVFSPQALRGEEPALRQQDLQGAVFYWDGATDDARITLANILDARACGALTLSRVEVAGVDWNEKAPSGAAHRLRLRDRLTGGGPAPAAGVVSDVQSPLEARARCVVSAAGPWTDALLARSGHKGPKLLAPTRGSHIVVPHTRLPVKNAVVLTHPSDGRVLFAIPWGDATIVGTTDIFDEKGPDRCFITSDEVSYLVDVANHYFPGAQLTNADVLSTWAGLRPLIAPPDSTEAGSVSREHHIEFSDPGLLVIAGGKLTTHREMARQALEKIYAGSAHWPRPLAGYAPSATLWRPLPAPAAPACRSGEALGHSDAGRLDLADIEQICRSQLPLSLEDLLVRRTHLYYKESDNGLGALGRMRETLCRELNWSAGQWTGAVSDYAAFLEAAVYAPLGRKFPADALKT